MKTFIICVLCVIAVYADPLTMEQQIKQYSRECRDELDFESGPNNNQDTDTKRPSIPVENCYLACMDKKLGWMTPEGTYDKKLLFDGSPPANLQIAEANLNTLVKNCKAQVGNDHCRMAACFHRMPKIRWE